MSTLEYVSKYSLNQDVFLLANNKIETGKVKKIIITAEIKDSICEITSLVYIITKESGENLHALESDVYETAELLKDSL